MLRSLLVIQTKDRQARLASPAHELIIMIPRVHGHETTSRYVQDDLVLLLQCAPRPIEVQPAGHGFLVRTSLGSRYANLARRIDHQPGSHHARQRTQIRRGAFVPSDAQMIDGKRRSNLADFLVGLLGTYQVVYAEDDRQQIPDALALNPHSRPEACVQRSRDPCSAEVGARVEAREGLWALEAYELAEVAGNVEVEESYEDGLPDGEFLGEEGGYAAEDWWAMAVASTGLLVCVCV